MLAPVQSIERTIWRVGREPRQGDVDLTPVVLAATIVAAGSLYGLFMGTWELNSVHRLLMVVYAALKVPLLIGVTSVVCLPGFFVLNTVLGLRDDLARALRAILANQAAFALALASLGPITAFIYLCGVPHRVAVLTNGVMFAVATMVAQVVLWRRYRVLAASNPRHTLMLWAWMALYIFVGIQMGWMLRPFVGSIDKPVTFFREEPFSNAYEVVLRLVLGR